ncbi:hypothetical protein [Geothrix alkalitolerans]|nr:hypothetical protein [Geothrix alkalitolerans]
MNPLPVFSRDKLHLATRLGRATPAKMKALAVALAGDLDLGPP